MTTKISLRKKWYKRWWGIIILFFILLFLVLSLASSLYIVKMIHNLRQSQELSNTISYEDIRSQVEGPSLISLGKNDAPITVVEFSDFNCVYCLESSEIGRHLIDSYKGSVRLIYRDLPIVDVSSITKALAGRCANEQGKFWEMYDTLFQYQDKTEISDMVRLAGTIGLNETAFQNCLDNQSHLSQIQKDYLDAEELKINGTPTWFINGNRISGYVPEEALISLIDKLLEYEGN